MSGVLWSSLDDRRKKAVAVAVAKEARHKYGLKGETAKDVLEFFEFYSAERETNQWTSKAQQTLIEIAAGSTPAVILREPREPSPPPSEDDTEEDEVEEAVVAEAPVVSQVVVSKQPKAKPEPEAMKPATTVPPVEPPITVLTSSTIGLSTITPEFVFPQTEGGDGYPIDAPSPEEPKDDEGEPVHPGGPRTPYPTSR